MLDLLLRAIQGAWSLAAALARWPPIAAALAEAPRRRRPQPERLFLLLQSLQG